MAIIPTRVQKWIILFSKTGITPDLTQDGPNRWILTFPSDGLPDDSAFGVIFTLRRNKRTKVDIELVLEGEKQKPKDLFEALGLISSTTGSKPSSGIGTTQQAARHNSVETRRASVIRV